MVLMHSHLNKASGLTKMVMAMEIIQVALKQMIALPKKAIPMWDYLAVLMQITMVQHNPMTHSQMTQLNGLTPIMMAMVTIPTAQIPMLVLQLLALLQ